MPVNDSFSQIPPNSTGNKIGTVQQVDSNSNTVQLQKIVVSDPVVNDAIAAVLNQTPVGTEYGEVVRNIPAVLTNNSFMTSSYAIPTNTGLTATNIIYLFNNSVNNVYVDRVLYSQNAGADASMRLQFHQITAENGTPGGYNPTIYSTNMGVTSTNAGSSIAGHIVANPTGLPTVPSYDSTFANPFHEIIVGRTTNINGFNALGTPSSWFSPLVVPPNFGFFIRLAPISSATLSGTVLVQLYWKEGTTPS